MLLMLQISGGMKIKSIQQINDFHLRFDICETPSATIHHQK